MVVVLKKRHSLHGKNLLPLIMRFKEADIEDIEVDSLARLKEEHRLERYTIEELEGEFCSLCGEKVEDFYQLAGKSRSKESAMVLLNMAIHLANEIGAPRGTPLQPLTPNSATTSNRKSATVTAAAGSPDQQQPVVNMTKKDSQPEDRILAVEKAIQDLKKDKGSQDFVNGFSIPVWELKTGFDPTVIEIQGKSHTMVNHRGEAIQTLTSSPSAEEVLQGNPEFKLDDLALHNPFKFQPGGIHRFIPEWEKICPCEESFVLDWLREGIDVTKYFVHFRGNFKGKSYDSDIPPSAIFQNALICEKFQDFLIDALKSRVENGSLRIWGQVGKCCPPNLVMPLTVEPSKPRLCHDERFLNLWIKDSPFKLDTLKEIPRLVDTDSFMTKIDDKSGYDHVLLKESSQTYFGLQFGGWFLVYTTLPFGFKASAYIYQSLGMVATGYCRSLGIPLLQYIDDRFVGEVQTAVSESGLQRAERAIYAVCQVLTRLGYYLGLGKCSFIPSQNLEYLGLIIDSCKQAFVLPERKILTFSNLRDQILSAPCVDVRSLQRFAGKCISFVLAVPAAKLYTVEVNRCISKGLKNSRLVQIDEYLRAELEHWKFLDTWEGNMPWREERHLQLVLATDASDFKWGASVVLKGDNLKMGDFWERDDSRPIHIKEAQALIKTLTALEGSICNHRVDAFVDNKALVSVWERQGRKDPSLNRVIKELYEITHRNNVDLHLVYIPSKENPADEPSRSVSRSDSTLSQEAWNRIEQHYGPHSVDLMAIDSNAMRSKNGIPLRHFTPFPMPESAGIIFFAQNVEEEGNPYVFPPFSMILPVLSFLKSRKVKICTMVVPLLHPRPVWWPFLLSNSISSFRLGDVGDKNILMVPSKKGYVEGRLCWPLEVFRLMFC